jgi:uncharacterized integral membrane protein
MSETPAAQPANATREPATTPIPAQPEGASPPVEAVQPAKNPLRTTRISGAWVGLIAAAIVLVLLLIFILQNTQSVSVSYFGASGHLPLGVAMLLAAVAGVLIAVIAGSLRIWQLRRYLRRSTRHK